MAVTHVSHAGQSTVNTQDRKVIFASSLGTVFEWYDFYLYGSLVAIIAKQFFAALDPTAGFVFALLAFAAGFIVRPFGALLFGRLGDLVGRKYTFLLTILIMGVSTFAVGILPNYEAIGVAAPVILIALRLLQGLALGGEYGSAATYVAEHAPQQRRGFYTAWLQTTATLGLLMSLMVILGTRTMLGEEAFAEWGWRVPFVLSLALLVISVWIRMSMGESPVFKKNKAQGGLSQQPLRESFTRWGNLKWVLIALFGLVAGQGVIWYTGQFYALFFLTQTLKVDAVTANLLVAASLLLATPCFVLFGALSDKLGRKPIILAGCLLAAFTYMPLYKALTQAANPGLALAHQQAPVVLMADASECSFQFNPTGTFRFTSSCDIAKQVLSYHAVNYEIVERPGRAAIYVGEHIIESHDARGWPVSEAKAAELALRARLLEAIKQAGYPERADPNELNHAMIVAILTLLVIYVAMVYGPMAAMLVELFPTRIRCTSMSLPYHIGNGWFGGLVPTAAFAIVAQTGDIYDGLWYPVGVALLTFVVGLLAVKETKGTDLEHSK